MAGVGGLLDRLRRRKVEPVVVPEPTDPTCYVCGKVLDSPPTGYYPTREEFERETMPAMAMVRAIEVMEVHRNHG